MNAVDPSWSSSIGHRAEPRTPCLDAARFSLSAVLLLALLWLPAGPAKASGILNFSVSGDEVTAEIDIGLLEADLGLEFDSAVGLSSANLDMSAQVVTILSMASRLPSSVSLAGLFAVKLEIDPPSTGGLSFSGPYTVELHTHNLSFSSGSTLRLFVAEDGGDFRDITASIGSGSYRVRGHGGGFSEFIIVSDSRDLDDVIELKYDFLEDLLDEYDSQISSSVATTLAAELEDSRDEWDADDISDALDELDDFIDEVETNAGSSIPDVWRSARDLDNVAGELLAAAQTLRFSLGLAP